MLVKCEYCQGMMEDTLDACPHCGATNKNVKRMANKTPQTIEELKRWYKDHNLPAYEVTRFFIGIDYKSPKAFGIYQDGNEFVVYKNKDNGERAVRYRGTDEAYAVNELYLKLKSEILNQKNHNVASRPNIGGQNIPKGSCLGGVGGTVAKVIAAMVAFSIGVTSPKMLLLFLALFLIQWVIKKKWPNVYKKIKYFIAPVWIMIFIIALYFVGVRSTPRYYDYGGDTYVSYENDYYYYDPYYDDYSYVAPSHMPYDFEDNSTEYEYDWNSGVTQFEDSDYYYDNLAPSYDSSSSYDSSDSWSDWDSGSSWDSYDSWDSGSSDWGSDW